MKHWTCFKPVQWLDTFLMWLHIIKRNRCCQLLCPRKPRWIIEWGYDPDGYTISCNRHIANLAPDDEVRIRPVEELPHE